MALIELGRVHGSSIVFSNALVLPEETEVVVTIEPVMASSQTVPVAGDEDISELPILGMVPDREDMSNSVAWMRTACEQWQQRPAERD